MARRKLELTVQEQLRQAIQGSDLTIYSLAKLTGISHQQISRFAKGQRGLTLGSFTALAAALDMQLVPVADPVAAPVAPVAVQDGKILDAIRSNTKRTGAARLADVFKTLQASNQALTLGTFHDSIRRLHAAGKVELSPWTQAMYQLENGQGQACLILGAEIMAFVEAKKER
jgi:transcriptional regulator with XRE-family HTH domain